MLVVVVEEAGWGGVHCFEDGGEGVAVVPEGMGRAFRKTQFLVSYYQHAMVQPSPEYDGDDDDDDDYTENVLTYRRSKTATPSSLLNSFSTPTTIISSPVFLTVLGSALNTLVVSVTSCPTRNGFTLLSLSPPRGQRTSPPAHMRRVNGDDGLYDASVPSGPRSASVKAGVKYTRW